MLGSRVHSKRQTSVQGKLVPAERNNGQFAEMFKVLLKPMFWVYHSQTCCTFVRDQMKPDTFLRRTRQQKIYTDYQTQRFRESTTALTLLLFFR